MPRRETDPYSSFNFVLTIGNLSVAGFSECSGLSMETTPIEYREGSDKVNTVRKQHGLMKYGNITLKRGVTKSNAMLTWLNTARDGDIKFDEKISIKLLNEKHEDAVEWTLNHAWPTKYTGPDLKANADEIAIETIEICHEGLERK